ncbi:MAG: hypothetical protein Q7S65_03350 [Nanoarchaeota archaeon]|nr:hypothetical protein [Nanoarchaeota archaeon]
MLDYKVSLAIIASILGVIGYFFYFRDVFRGKTKPHAFSWLLWGLLGSIAFAGQLVGNAGPGAWVTAFTALSCLLIFVAALKIGEKRIVFADWLSLAGALVCLLLWYLTNNPLLAVVLAILIDAFAFFPTFRKSFSKPEEETASTYILNGTKYFIALFALNQYSLLTTLYPAYLVLTEWSFVAMVLIRRRQLAKK